MSSVVRSRHNEYAGINAHLNSILQNVAGEWESFHASHIVDLACALNQHLPDGYEARVEKSLQIREIALTDEGQRTRRRTPPPDVTVVSMQSPAMCLHSPLTVPLGATAIPIIETMDVDPEMLLNAVVIYRVNEDELTGRPITRIQLQSPTNKPPHDGYERYREKRNSTLQSAMPLVEIDYLHQTPPVMKGVAPYPQAGAHAYRIVVSDPRPALQYGVSAVYEFDVDAPIPKADIPLENTEVVRQFDFGVPYTVTYENTVTYPRMVDYARTPLRFDTYSPDDQRRILQRMAAVQNKENVH
jgi:hypothetical protein